MTRKQCSLKNERTPDKSVYILMQSKVNKETIFSVVIIALTQIREDFELDQEEDISPETRLIGPQSGISSITLVALIAEIEDAISDKFEKEIVLADERAMSLKQSPFRRISTLVDYIAERINNKQNEKA